MNLLTYTIKIFQNSLHGQVNKMTWFDILGIYTLVSFILLIFTAGVLDNDDAVSFKALFVYQYKLYEDIKDKLNVFGIIILEALATILTFGASLMMFVIGVIVLLLILIWKLFYFCFKKR